MRDLPSLLNPAQCTQVSGQMLGCLRSEQKARENLIDVIILGVLGIFS
ncbi:hypothetical protein PPIS_a1629 [Pseudoalteromonas piscicida]|uniref:Uncharacterized protein n=1 Tax=Pseudoalteromonas piscicida TaxID=43662 RepID=A0ABM6NCY1_PSEO7|nr:hypothetical protein PPIS_a1629 [Pseudoalteromonas piscicida]MBE0373226.1 hypothetical protein [Pseudoalteromonas flavipulchra NCIMB 2033 = ATCC BAA-314]